MNEINSASSDLNMDDDGEMGACLKARAKAHSETGMFGALSGAGDGYIAGWMDRSKINPASPEKGQPFNGFGITAESLEKATQGQQTPPPELRIVGRLVTLSKTGVSIENFHNVRVDISGLGVPQNEALRDCFLKNVTVVISGAVYEHA